MTIAMKKVSKRILCLIMGMFLLLGAFHNEAQAAGVETLNKGTTDIGSFTFTDTNTTPTKTINGTHVTFEVTWRVADGANGIPNVDQGVGDAKLTMKILNASTGAVITGPVVFYRDTTDESWYVYSQISANVSYGQKVKVWFDASSVGASNGHYRSIYIYSFTATVS